VSRAPIAEVDVLVLRVPEADRSDLDGSSETVVVRLVDEAGNVGVGEADAPAAAVRELVLMEDVHALSRGLAGILRGRDPFPIAALWDELYGATIYHGRRGLGIHALSAVDVALHDLAARQLGRPVYELLGGARRPAVTPYATLYAGPVAGRTAARVTEALVSLAERALGLGFRAVKVEPLLEDVGSDGDVVRCLRGVREAVGPDVTLMADFGYRWRDWRDALRVLDAAEECDLWFAEATLQHDDLDGHRKLAARVRTRLCGAEFAATVHECREWLERGGVDVLQPDVNRCGGLTELRRIADLAELHGALVVPHCWKTGITAAAARHFQAATANAPWVEMFHPDLFPSPLRAELTRPEPQLADGVIPLPAEPGLGVELDPDAVERYRVA
jgi:L-alanine-DL-glutamate epimerase-like enolase superfamily enzyme